MSAREGAGPAGGSGRMPSLSVKHEAIRKSAPIPIPALLARRCGRRGAAPCAIWQNKADRKRAAGSGRAGLLPA